jgi:hypothetical protein
MGTNDVVAVPISLSTYREVLSRFPDTPHTLIEDAVLDYLNRTAEDWHRPRRDRGGGVMWESLFLPEKTRLRTMHHREYKQAEVKGDSLVYEGKTFPSVSQVTNHMRGGTQNNAWRVIEVLLPNHEKWAPAESLR